MKKYKLQADNNRNRKQNILLHFQEKRRKTHYKVGLSVFYCVLILKLGAELPE